MGGLTGVIPDTSSPVIMEGEARVTGTLVRPLVIHTDLVALAIITQALVDVWNRKTHVAMKAQRAPLIHSKVDKVHLFC